MVDNVYPFSVFYFSKSVFDQIGKENNLAQKLFLKSILMNIRFKDKIGTNITFTSEDIMDAVKEEAYVDKFKGLMQLGKNIAYPEDTDDITGNQNFKLVQIAINKDGDVLGLVKIVVEDYETKKAIQKIVKEGNYPIAIVSCEEALKELDVIESRLMEIFG